MPRYLILPRDDGSAFAAMSPAEAQAVIERYIAWSEGLRASGALQLGEKLKDFEGRVLARVNGQTRVTDGPFVETREILGGLWIVESDSYESVVDLARGCPHLEFGSLEIRAIEEL